MGECLKVRGMWRKFIYWDYETTHFLELTVIRNAMFWKPHFEFNTKNTKDRPPSRRSLNRAYVEILHESIPFPARMLRPWDGTGAMATQETSFKPMIIIYIYIWKARDLWYICVKYVWLAYPMASINRHLIAMSRYNALILHIKRTYSWGELFAISEVWPLQWRIEGLVGLW